MRGICPQWPELPIPRPAARTARGARQAQPLSRSCRGEQRSRAAAARVSRARASRCGHAPHARDLWQAHPPPEALKHPRGRRAGDKDPLDRGSGGVKRTQTLALSDEKVFAAPTIELAMLSSFSSIVARPAEDCVDDPAAWDNVEANAAGARPAPSPLVVLTWATRTGLVILCQTSNKERAKNSGCEAGSHAQSPPGGAARDAAGQRGHWCWCRRTCGGARSTCD